jgi:hypothetical protein
VRAAPVRVPLLQVDHQKHKILFTHQLPQFVEVVLDLLGQAQEIQEVVVLALGLEMAAPAEALGQAHQVKVIQEVLDLIQVLDLELHMLAALVEVQEVQEHLEQDQPIL